MSAVKIKNNLYWIGVKNPELKIFDIIMETKKGTTYNSYILEDEKVAVFDTVKNGYTDEFINNIKEVIGDRKVDYVIVHHTELDHSGSLKKLLGVYKDATVVSSISACSFLKEITNSDFKWQEAKGELNLGKHTLSFISAPNLHWPDTIFTYIKDMNTLFTCDFLGAHYCPEGLVTDESKENYDDEVKYYFDCIMGPFKKFVSLGLDKIKDLTFDTVLTSHGPIHREKIDFYMKKYREWAKLPDIKNEVNIFYVSAYSNTEHMANFIADKLTEKGIPAFTYDINSMKMEDIISKIETSKGFMIGSPTINQDAVKPAWDVLTLINPIVNRGKAAAAFGSYGWSGEGVPMLTERLKSLKLKVLPEGLKFKFVPSEEEYKKAEEFVKNFEELLK
ncbi:MAG: FprA family A-type flavoprotein [Bacillota bacterium]|nr:FprA family A-type flavoprotein [Bacillota bacterium]